MTDKLFTHAGYSKLNGQYKFRVANDALRVKVLEKSGHEDIQITGLLQPMTKVDAVKALLKAGFADANPLAKAALEAELDKREDTPKAAKKEQKPTKETKKPKKEKAITLDTIMAKAIKAPVANGDIEIPQVSATEKTRAQIEAELDNEPF
jgi:hypothetical protein